MYKQLSKVSPFPSVINDLINNYAKPDYVRQLNKAIENIEKWRCYCAQSDPDIYLFGSSGTFYDFWRSEDVYTEDCEENTFINRVIAVYDRD